MTASPARTTGTIFQKSAPYSLNMRHTATHCNTLQHTATHCNTLQHTATHKSSSKVRSILIYHATHCNTPQHATTHCNTLQHTATRCNTLQHAATHNTFSTAGSMLIQQFHVYLQQLHQRRSLAVSIDIEASGLSRQTCTPCAPNLIVCSSWINQSVLQCIALCCSLIVCS